MFVLLLLLLLRLSLPAPPVPPPPPPPVVCANPAATNGDARAPVLLCCGERPATTARGSMPRALRGEGTAAAAVEAAAATALARPPAPPGLMGDSPPYSSLLSASASKLPNPPPPVEGALCVRMTMRRARAAGEGEATPAPPPPPFEVGEALLLLMPARPELRLGEEAIRSPDQRTKQQRRESGLTVDASGNK